MVSPMKKVLVTGANGHLGFNLAKLLATSGYQVRVTVRNLNDGSKTNHLKPLGVELVEADLMRPESLDKAMAGIEGLFQVAAVYATVASDPRKEIIDPSVVGGLNALKAAHRAGIQKVVFTSSVAAVGSVPLGAPPRDESFWNERGIDPYTRAKTLAEKQAWEFAEKNDLKLVTILPSAIIGPGFYRHTPSTLLFELLLRRKVPFVLPMSLGLVDARDCARAHILAFENPRAQGRYIVSSWFLSISEIFQTIQRIDPNIRIPSAKFPTKLMGVLPALDWLGNKLMGTPRFTTREFIAEYGGRALNCTSEKIRRDLEWTPMDLTQSLQDTLAWTRQIFLQV
jgi:dihydroflavonol-4-reductase